jgi:hypothetical protein
VLPDLPPDQGATLEERMAAAVWSRDDPGPYVDTMVEAQIFGVSKVNVDQFVAKGRLPGCQLGMPGKAETGVPAGAGGGHRSGAAALNSRRHQNSQ